MKGGFFSNPTVVDACSEGTTQLLSDDGFVVEFKDDDGNDQKETYKQREFEKRFFSGATISPSAKRFWKTPCAISSAARLVSPSSSLSVRSTLPSSRRS
jgi:hypothetical protein